MSSAAINTIVNMMKSLPEDKQDRIVEYMKEYILDLQDEQTWQNSFDKSQDKLVNAAKLAKQQIAEGKAETMDYNRL